MEGESCPPPPGRKLNKNLLHIICWNRDGMYKNIMLGLHYKKSVESYLGPMYIVYIANHKAITTLKDAFKSEVQFLFFTLQNALSWWVNLCTFRRPFTKEQHCNVVVCLNIE